MKKARPLPIVFRRILLHRHNLDADVGYAFYFFGVHGVADFYFSCCAFLVGKGFGDGGGELPEHDAVALRIAFVVGYLVFYGVLKKHGGTVLLPFLLHDEVDVEEGIFLCRAGAESYVELAGLCFPDCIYVEAQRVRPFPTSYGGGTVLVVNRHACACGEDEDDCCCNGCSFLHAVSFCFIVSCSVRSLRLAADFGDAFCSCFFSFSTCQSV